MITYHLFKHVLNVLSWIFGINASMFRPFRVKRVVLRLCLINDHLMVSVGRDAMPAVFILNHEEKMAIPDLMMIYMILVIQRI